MPVDEAKSLELDPLSELTMTYTVDGFIELREDIKKNGLLVPVVLRDGKVLDGRHRLKACIQLGVDIAYREVGLISDEDAVDMVISNSLHKATTTDASKIEAYLLCCAKGLSNKDMPTKFSRLNINTIKKIRFIEKENPEYIRVILRQNKVTVYSKRYNKIEDCGTIHSLYSVLRDNVKLKDKVTELVTETEQSVKYTVDVGEYFNNPAAEDEYWKLFNQAKEEGINLHPATEFGKQVASLVKSKYSKE